MNADKEKFIAEFAEAQRFAEKMSELPPAKPGASIVNRSKR